MRRADLKSGYVVQLRCGALYMVARAGNFTKILVTPYNWVYLNSDYDDELKCIKKIRDTYRESSKWERHCKSVWSYSRNTELYKNVQLTFNRT